MKKTYITPALAVETITEECLLSGSGVSSEYGIDYGGVDTEGSQYADARELLLEF